MEAATIQNKNSINKGKLKKTIKNILCRPDPVFWPSVSDEQGKLLLAVLSKHKVPIPEFKKPHWKELKLIPKEKRPKPPKIEKVTGLLFGITECSTAVDSGECAAVIIESTVNPRTIVQPILETCVNAKVPVVCLDGLRKSSTLNFGIPTSCLGIKNECLLDIRNKIHEFAKDKVPQNKPIVKKLKAENFEKAENSKSDKNAMDIQHTPPNVYLYRTSKKSRVFVPPSEEKVPKTRTEFRGQNFIEFSDQLPIHADKKFRKMIVKRIANNPNRAKVK